MPARRDLEKILIIGSGPIVIGQACEFDYSGNQAVKALREEGYKVVLVNPNPATVMTTPGNADSVYMDPLDVEYVEEIIRLERPDAVLATMGGQTALNLAMDLDKAGVFERHKVEVIGASIDSIRLAEDRGEFKRLIDSIGLESPRSELVSSVEEGLAFAEEVGVPLIIRPSYTLGGKGGSIANTMDEAREFIDWALTESPVHTALIDESLIGWKEFELEVMRDQADNAVVICSIENVDPMGVHTGDSITVAPVQTLTDREYQRMRTAAIDILRAVGVDCGGSNVQFAVDPESDRMVVIEMNPRVSRSSALASKATGFPIARSSARLSVGFTLDEIINDITGKTVSCFEPSLDYVAVKVPRFELEKFPLGYKSLGTQMKSVGESLAIGRTYLEALNKAFRAAEYGVQGIEELVGTSDRELDTMVRTLHPRRIFAAYTLLKRRGPGYLPELSSITGYDPWFLHYFLEQIDLEKQIAAGSREPMDPELLREAKRMGLSDLHIAGVRNDTPEHIESLRESAGIRRTYHFVDTCSGEFEANTPYFYSSFGEIDEGEPIGEEGVVILASGPNRIGQGLEFDTCCTLSSMAYRRLGTRTVIVNCNPETVSTDFNVSDRLYLEPLTAEDVKDVLRKEGIKRVIVQLGGQSPLNMAEELEAFGAEIVGTSVKSIHDAEDRGLFTRLVESVGLRQPENRMAATFEEVRKAAWDIGYPVLVRPSFVLGGRSMVIVYSEEEMISFLERSGIEISAARPVLVDQFLEDAFEYDLDAVSDGENVYVGGIMQHIEAAGIHSGDSACVFPPHKSKDHILDQMVEATATMARKLKVRGFINIQFAVKNEELYVIEVNPRASRTVPFLSKASGVDMVDAAVRVWSGTDLVAQGLVPAGTGTLPSGGAARGVAVGRCVTGYAVKEAMFSFDRFREIDPLLGPEMRSTGEAIGIGETFGEAFSKAQAAVNAPLPRGGRVFVSVHDDDKMTMLPVVQELNKLGFEIVATRGTAQFLFSQGLFPEVVLKVHEGHPNVIDHMRAGRINLVINTPLGRYTQQDDDYLRIESVRRRIAYTTTTSAAEAALEGITYLRQNEVVPRRLPDPAR
ncbi:MAG: carbamoyl-phosphate synthase large subunit [Spirochaetaceae bacterium]